jgi:hypothetical protein
MMSAEIVGTAEGVIIAAMEDRCIGTQDRAIVQQLLNG